MEMIVALIVFGALLAIALFGLATSNRAARLNNASRQAIGNTVHPHDQRLGQITAADRMRDTL